MSATTSPLEGEGPFAALPAAPGPSVRFQVLGPLGVVSDGCRLPLRGIVQRAMLGFLLLHANRVVATSQLVQALWPRGAPSTARKMIQNAVSALRGTLARAGVDVRTAALLTQAPGYVMRVDVSCLDLTHFQDVVRRGRAELAVGSPSVAAELLREALACWRGSALEDLAESGFDWPKLAALRGARVSAQEDLFEAELRAGRHHEIMAELEAAAELVPSRERMCRLLMLALYRCGRQVEALDAYRRIGHRVQAGAGVEPGRELRELRAAILRQEPSLSPPPVVSSTGAVHLSRGWAPTPERPRTPRWLVRAQATASPAEGIPGPNPRGCGHPSDRSAELEFLHSTRHLSRRRERPHLIMILGEPDSGTSDLVATFASGLGPEEGLTVQPPNGDRVWLVDRRARDAALDSLRAALERVTPARPLVIVCEELHRRDEAVVRCLDDAVRAAGPRPLLVIVTAEPAFLRSRPHWGEGIPWVTTITLDR